MVTRMDLHKILCDILGSSNVYYQPPESMKIKYPGVVYFLDDIQPLFADDIKYKKDKRYTVTLITKDPEPDKFIDDILELKYCNFERSYVVENLNHFVFEIIWQ